MAVLNRVYYINTVIVIIGPSDVLISGQCLNVSVNHLTCCVLDAASRTLPPTPSPDPSKFDATNILAFPSSVIAEQLTKIETVRRLYTLMLQ